MMSISLITGIILGTIEKTPLEPVGTMHAATGSHNIGIATRRFRYRGGFQFNVGVAGQRPPLQAMGQGRSVNGGPERMGQPPTADIDRLTPIADGPSRDSRRPPRPAVALTLHRPPDPRGDTQHGPQVDAGRRGVPRPPFREVDFPTAHRIHPIFGRVPGLRGHLLEIPPLSMGGILCVVPVHGLRLGNKAKGRLW